MNCSSLLQYNTIINNELLPKLELMNFSHNMHVFVYKFIYNHMACMFILC